MKALLCSRKGLFILNQNNRQWEVENFHFEAIKTSVAEYNPFDQSIWIGVNHGHWGTKLHVSRDGGKSFQEVGVPKFPDSNKESNKESSNESNKDKLNEFWAISFDPSGRVYIGTQPAAVFYSDDQGKSWNLVESLYNDPHKDNWFGGGANETCLHSILVHPENQDHLTVGISCAGVLVSEDRGASWEYRNKGLKAYFLPDPDANVGQDPHIVIRSKRNPDLLWQQNHCGIFKSEDSGKNWQDLSKKPGVVSAFGWGLCIDERDDNIVYTLPAVSDEVRVTVDKRLYVQKTVDGGESWKGITEGLPSEQCFDICYRHAFDLKSDTIAFATTTGNMYSSYDQGESWTQDFGHLPPIYSLRLF